jgi:hypothetical protein
MQATGDTLVRCAIYTRVSTEEQAKEGYSLAAQDEWPVLSMVDSEDLGDSPL